MRIALLLLMASLFAVPAHAQVLQEETCPGFSGVDVIANVDCMQAELERADAQLNAIWKQAIAHHPSGGDRNAHKQEIRKAQRAWIAFRDSDCDAVSQIGIPKYWELNRLSCLVAHTRARRTALKYFYVD